MVRRVLMIGLCVLVLASGMTFAQADAGGGLDPLLELLVEQGVITMEQALAVQAEYDRRAAGETVEAAVERAPEAAFEPEEIEPAEAVEEAAAPAPEKWYDRLDFRGDIRLRFEAFDQEGLSPNDRRERFRVRIRPGIYTDITDWMDVGLQLRTGDPDDPVSDNQSLDGAFSKQAISISEGFVGFHPTDWLDLTFGKFDPKKMWVVSDMQWDDDVTVEGAMQELSYGPIKAAVYQYVLEERGGGSDAYLLGGQLYAEVGSRAFGTFTVGAGYDDWVRPQLVADLTLSGDLGGNEVTNLLDDEDRLVSDFRIANAFLTWSCARRGRWPVELSLFGYRNLGARDLGEDYDTGYLVRLQVGDYKEKGQLMFRLSRYYSEPDAIFYVFAQSDTTRASDVEGYRFDVRMGFVKKSYFNLTWYHTDPVYADVATMDRLQMDYIIRF